MARKSVRVRIPPWAQYKQNILNGYLIIFCPGVPKNPPPELRRAKRGGNVLRATFANPALGTLRHFIPQGKQVYSEQSEEGTWRSGLARLIYTEKVGGSNPSVPTGNLGRGSSVVEHFSEKEGVVSSILTRGTLYYAKCGSSSVVERLVANEKIAGSIPVSRLLKFILPTLDPRLAG